MHKKIKKILLSGGGTGGSVTPLLAIADQLKKDARNSDAEFIFLFMGTKKGIEKEIVEKEGIEFKSIHSGKLRRYFDWKNFTDIFLIKLGFFESLRVLFKWKPDIILTAGSFASVPVAIAGWLLRVPVIAHQQDIVPGLANKIITIFAKVVTVTFEKSLNDFRKKAVWTGNPIRQSLKITNYKLQISNFFNFNNDLPCILVLGGGTGASFINELVWGGLSNLEKYCNIIQLTGKGKSDACVYDKPNVKCFEFLDAEQLAQAYAVSDLVVTRAGMGVLSEISVLGKPSIIIPIPDSHQEDNAKLFKDNDAAIVLDQKKLTSNQLVEEIRKLLENKELQEKLGGNIKAIIKEGASVEISRIIKETLD